MPKKIDHAARRLELAEALWRLTRRDGWEAVSLRKVAAEAGVSMGMVQHYFTSKDEMLLFALDMITEDTRARIRSRIAELPQPHTPRRLVATVLAEMLPQPARRQTEIEAASVFVRRFLLRPESAEELAASNPDLRAFLTEQIRTHRASAAATGGAATEDETAERDAKGLIALLDGLMLNIANGALTSEIAFAILEAQLDHLFGCEPGDTKASARG